MLGANGKNRRAWLTPDQLVDAGTFCRRLSIPDDPHLIAAVSGALHELTLSYNWEQFGTMTPQEAAALMDGVLWEYFHSDGCETVPAPYWDDDTGEDADDEAPSPFPWYEDVADWLVTAFLAASFTPAAAIEFVTTARKLRLWFRTRDYGAIVRVLLDGLEIGTQDTYSLEPGIVEFAYDIPEGQGFQAQAEGEYTLRLEHTGTANASAVATDDGYGMEVIRKNIAWGFDDGGACPYNLRYNTTTGKVELSSDGGETWRDADQFDPRTFNQYPPVTTSDPACDAAARIAAALQEISAAILPAVQGGVIAEGLGAVIIGWLAVFAGFNILLAAAALLAAPVLAVGFSDLLTAYNTMDWDALMCDLKCRMDSDGRLSDAQYSDFVASYIPTLTAAQQTLLNLSLLIAGMGGLNAFAATRSETGDCDECGECEWTATLTPENVPDGIYWDFPPDTIYSCANVLQRGFNSYGEVGEFKGNTIWLTELDVNVYALHVRFRVFIPTGSVVTAIYFAQDQGAVNPAVRRFYVNELQKCNPVEALPVRFTGLTITNQWLEVEYYLFFNTASGIGGLVSLEIEGTGRQPF